MRLLLMLLIALVAEQAVPLPVCACATSSCKQREALRQIQLKLEQYYKRLPASSPKPPPAKLAPKLLRTYKQHGLHPMLVARLIATESQFRINAVNRRSHDYGLMQINRSHGVHKNCLEQWECNYDAGVAVLVWAKSRGNICRYNVGSGALTGRKLANCERYLGKLNALKGVL